MTIPITAPNVARITASTLKTCGVGVPADPEGAHGRGDRLAVPGDELGVALDVSGRGGDAGYRFHA